MNCSLVFSINEVSEIAHVRREVSAVAKGLGFDEAKVGKVALIVTEACANVVKHAHSGELIVRELNGDGAAGLEVLALDNGPGIANVANALRDGYSTAGTPGTGLGAVQRLSDEFDIQSSVGAGTAIVARVWARQSHGGSSSQIQVGAVSCPKSGETFCGDAWAIQQHIGKCMIVVVDGLGHGQLASDAAQAALRVFHQRATWEPAAIIERAGGALRDTRGAAMAIAEMDLDNQVLRFCGVGNITGMLIAPNDRTHGLVSMNGTVGQPVRTIRQFTYPCPDGSIVIVHSDGLSSHWNLDEHRGIESKDPSVLAGVLYRDHKRSGDDVTVVVTKRTAHEAKNHENSFAIDRNSI
jgi:anti-sigma regulatory factor (Ser/Thr protein kinase)